MVNLRLDAGAVPVAEPTPAVAAPTINEPKSAPAANDPAAKSEPTAKSEPAPEPNPSSSAPCVTKAAPPVIPKATMAPPPPPAVPKSVPSNGEVTPKKATSSKAAVALPK